MKKNPFTGLLYGWIIIFGSLFLMGVIFALILSMTAMNEASLNWVSLIVVLIILFIGGIVAGAKGKQKGWVIGGIIGIGFTFFTFVVQYLGYEEGFSMNQIFLHMGYILAAILGGITGVNVSNNAKSAS